jgi:ElaB/YqjD/DUF883 family membrane-anchored ribosome-binding protein
MEQGSTATWSPEATPWQPAEASPSSLTDKLEMLEQKVTDGVEGATTAVTDTVATVKAAMGDTMDALKGAVHDSLGSVLHVFDVRDHVRQHPWLMLGGAAVVGYLLANLLQRTRR